MHRLLNQASGSVSTYTRLRMGEVPCLGTTIRRFRPSLPSRELLTPSKDTLPDPAVMTGTTNLSYPALLPSRTTIPVQRIHRTTMPTSTKYPRDAGGCREDESSALFVRMLPSKGESSGVSSLKHPANLTFGAQKTSVSALTAGTLSPTYISYPSRLTADIPPEDRQIWPHINLDANGPPTGRHHR